MIPDRIYRDAEKFVKPDGKVHNGMMEVLRLLITRGETVYDEILPKLTGDFDSIYKECLALGIDKFIAVYREKVTKIIQPSAISANGDVVAQKPSVTPSPSNSTHSSPIVEGDDDDDEGIYTEGGLPLDDSTEIVL